MQFLLFLRLLFSRLKIYPVHHSTDGGPPWADEWFSNFVRVSWLSIKHSLHFSLNWHKMTEKCLPLIHSWPLIHRLENQSFFKLLICLGLHSVMRRLQARRWRRAPEGCREWRTHIWSWTSSSHGGIWVEVFFLDLWCEKRLYSLPNATDRPWGGWKLFS